MNTYTFYFVSGASTTVRVEAEDYEEAIETAYDGLPSGLCHQCATSYDVGDFELDEDEYELNGEIVKAAK